MRATLQRAFIPDTWAERAFWVFVAVPVSIVAWQAFDRAQPAVVTERTLLTPEVRPGGVVQVRVKQEQRFPAEVTVYRSLYDGQGFRFDYGVQVIPPKELEPEFTSQIPVLRAASPGRAKMTTTACWERPFNVVHQVWPVCVQMKPIEFTIRAD